MAYSKKTWKDRITEYPNRRELTHSDSSTELVTVARSEGTISQEGDAFSAQNMNDLEGRIDSEFSAVDQNLQDINDNLSGFKFYPTGTDIVGLIADDSAYIDENGNYVIWGTATAEQLVEDNPNTYKAIASTEDTRGMAGADTGIPFKGGIDLSYIEQNLGKINPLQENYGTNTLEVRLTHTKELFIFSALAYASSAFSCTSDTAQITEIYKTTSTSDGEIIWVFLAEGEIGEKISISFNSYQNSPQMLRLALYDDYASIVGAYKGRGIASYTYSLKASGKALVIIACYSNYNHNCTSANAEIIELYKKNRGTNTMYVALANGSENDIITLTNGLGTNWGAMMIIDLN